MQEVFTIETRCSQCSKILRLLPDMPTDVILHKVNKIEQGTTYTPITCPTHPKAKVTVKILDSQGKEIPKANFTRGAQRKGSDTETM